MAATNSIIIMAVMASCPSKLNRYGGYSLDTIGAIHLGPSIPGYSRPEPCPFDGNHRPVLAQWAYVNATDGNTYYNGADGINDAGTQVFDIAAFPHHTVAYSDTECTRQPFNPTQPQVFGIFVGVMVCYGFINSVSIKAMDSMLKASIFIHIFGAFCTQCASVLSVLTPASLQARWRSSSACPSRRRCTRRRASSGHGSSRATGERLTGMA